LPAQTAQQILAEVHESFVSFHKAIIAYYKNPSNFTGKPRLPNYLNKTNRPAIPFSLQNIINAGRLTKLQNRINILDADYKAWLKFDIIKHLNKLTNRKNGDELREFTIQPTKIGIKINAIFRHDFKVKDNSAIAFLENNAKPKMSDKEKADLLKNKGYKVAGVDPGEKSIITFSVYDGSNAGIIDPRNYYKDINVFDDKIDQLKSEFALKKNLTIQNEIDVILKKKSNYINNYIHQLSFRFVNIMDKRNVDIIVAGNSGRLKENTAKHRNNIGNRKAHSFPHDKLYSMIEYKAKMKGIVFLRTEEPYTSKACFANNDSLNWNEGDNRSFTVSRKGSIYKSKTAPKGWKRINADVNGSYNIIRKLFPDLIWNEELTSRYDIYWMKPKKP